MRKDGQLLKIGGGFVGFSVVDCPPEEMDIIIRVSTGDGDCIRTQYNIGTDVILEMAEEGRDIEIGQDDRAEEYRVRQEGAGMSNKSCLDAIYEEIRKERARSNSASGLSAER